MAVNSQSHVEILKLMKEGEDFKAKVFLSKFIQAILDKEALDESNTNLHLEIERLNLQYHALSCENLRLKHLCDELQKLTGSADLAPSPERPRRYSSKNTDDLQRLSELQKPTELQRLGSPELAKVPEMQRRLSTKNSFCMVNEPISSPKSTNLQKISDV